MSQAEESLRDRYLGPLVLFVTPRWVKPNHLTALRAVLVCFAFGMYLAGMSLQKQVAVLAVAALTDCMDGILARGRKQFSHAGAYLDHGVDWLLGGWTGILVLIHGLMPLLLIVWILIPQVGIVVVDRIRAAGIHEERREKRALTIAMGAANFQISAFARFQFFTVMSGFFLLLLGHARVSPALNSLGRLFLYVTVGLAWMQLVETSLRLTRERNAGKADAS